MQRLFLAVGWGMAFLATLASAAFFVALFVIACRSVPNGHEGDLGTWAGAVFTGLAFGGTIWLASSSERRRREELRLRGEVILPALFGYLLEMRLRVSTIHAFLGHWRDLDACEKTDESWRHLSSRCMENAKACPQIPDNYLLDVMVISRKLVNTVHIAQAQMRGLFATMHPYADKDVMVRFDDMEVILDSANDCMKNLKKAKDIVSTLLDAHGFSKD